MAIRHHPHYDAVHRVRTGDGWPIALYEYKPASPPIDSGAGPKAPLLAVHGAFSRYNVYDIVPGTGLAPWLAARGWHVFALDLRGRGRSLPRNASARAGALYRRGWTYDDFMRHDIPAAIGAVTQKSGAAQTDYIGHSMGGLLAYTYLSQTHDERVRRVVTVGSPGAWDRPAGAELPPEEKRFDLLQAMNLIMKVTPLIPVHLMTRLLALLDERAPESALNIALNARNTDPEVVRTLLWHGLTPVSSKKFKTFLSATKIGSPDGARRIFDNFTHPAMLIAGQRDRLVPATLVRDTYEALASKQKAFLHCAESEGFSADYGHTDLLIGRHVTTEIFPRIREWLAAG